MGHTDLPITGGGTGSSTNVNAVNGSFTNLHVTNLDYSLVDVGQTGSYINILAGTIANTGMINTSGITTTTIDASGTSRATTDGLLYIRGTQAAASDGKSNNGYNAGWIILSTENGTNAPTGSSGNGGMGGQVWINLGLGGSNDVAGTAGNGIVRLACPSKNGASLQLQSSVSGLEGGNDS